MGVEEEGVMRGLKNLCGSIGVMVILLVTLFTGASALAYEIWVTNQGTDKVQVIDSATLKEIASISTDSKPHNIEFSPDFTRAYVSNVGAGTVTVIDAVGRKIVTTVPTGKGAHGVNRSPSGRLLYVTNTGDETVSIIDTSSLKVVKTVSAGRIPSVAIFTPDERGPLPMSGAGRCGEGGSGR
jgi:YVTN family beta-propeller protein